MQEQRWRQIDTIFHGAMQLSPRERESYLRQASGDDTGLRDEIEALVKSHEASAEFLSRPAMVQPDRVFGPYRVIHEIGRGGMGIVYLAERIDRQFEKRVAIKVVPDVFLPEQTRKAMEFEVPILASVEHPNIARLMDAGVTPEGFRWIALEYVDGDRVDKFAASQGLSERQRLLLFQQICDAVQYLHRSLIVHRDLKPSNILVTTEGQPKLLDFGIARVVSLADTGTDMTQAPAFSPGYASPEQLAGKRATTTADVFSLGVVLYELLTEKPYRLEHGLEVDAEARLEGLAGDLASIVRKAVRPDPDQRYLSVSALSDDLRRYLAGEPILARPDSAWYRVRRFVGRHRWGVAVSAAAVILGVFAVATVVYQSRLAQRRFTQMREFSREVVWDLAAKLPNFAGNRGFRRELLQSGIGYLDTLSREAGQDVPLSLELARGYLRTADALSLSSSGLVPDLPAGATNYQKAIAFAERVGNGSPEWDEAQDILISARAKVSAYRKNQPGLHAALEQARVRYRMDPSRVRRAEVLADCEYLAGARRTAALRRALAVVETTYRARPNQEDAQRLYFGWVAKATLQVMFETPKSAWEIFAPAVGMGRALLAAHPRDQALAYQLAMALGSSAPSRMRGQPAGLAQAREELMESVAIFDKYRPVDPTDFDYRGYSAMTRMGISDLEFRYGNHRAALTAALEGLEIMKPFPGTPHEDPSYRMGMAGLHVFAARAYHGANQLSKACEHYRESDRFYGRPRNAPPGSWFGELFGYLAEGLTVCRMP